MQLPMIGDIEVLVHQVKPYTIHGDQYYQLMVTRIGGATNDVGAIAVPQHAIAGTPQEGDELTVNFLMGQVTSAKLI